MEQKFTGSEIVFNFATHDHEKTKLFFQRLMKSKFSRHFTPYACFKDLYSNFLSTEHMSISMFPWLVIIANNFSEGRGDLPDDV